MKQNAAHDRAGWAVGAAFFVLYALTATRGLQFADSGELQTVALLGGIPHASGYPLWTLLANLFARLPIAEPEFRVTLFSALCGALALVLLVRRLGEMGVGVASSGVAAAWLGVTFSFWRFAARAEVYTLAVCMALLALGAVLAARPRRAAFLLGLVLVVHLAFAPAVAVAGLMLAWREWRSAPRDPWRLPALAGAFLLGLTPYLLLVAFDAMGVRANYLELVRENAAFMGWKGPPIESPWQGLAWLLTGRNVYPPDPIGFHPRSIAAQLPDCGAVLFLFELGPLAAPLALVGLARGLRRDRAIAIGLAAAFALTVAFAAWLQFGALLHLFLLPALVLGVILSAFALDALLAGGAPAARTTALAIAAFLALAIPPAWLRVHAERHPIGPRAWRALDEDREYRMGILPAAGGDAGAGAWADSALARFPDRALVLASWTFYTPLRHRQLVEGRRPDLTLRQILVGTLVPRVRAWQREHDLALAPVVMAADRARVAALIPAADSLTLPGGRTAFVLRRPVPDSVLSGIESGR